MQALPSESSSGAGVKRGSSGVRLLRGHKASVTALHAGTRSEMGDLMGDYEDTGYFVSGSADCTVCEHFHGLPFLFRSLPGVQGCKRKVDVAVNVTESTFCRISVIFSGCGITIRNPEIWFLTYVFWYIQLPCNSTGKGLGPKYAGVWTASYLHWSHQVSLNNQFLVNP